VNESRRAGFSLDIFWLRRERLEESDKVPNPDVLVQEIVADFEPPSNNSAKWPRLWDDAPGKLR